MKKLRFILLAFTIVFGSTFSQAATTIAISPGNWGDAIWSNGVPGCYDTIVIPAGIQVDITSNVDLTGCADSIVVEIYGRLEFTNGARLKLPCGSDVYVYAGGSMGKSGPGGGNSAFLEICGTTYWNAAAGEQTGPTTFCDGGCPGISPLPVELVRFEGKLNTNNEVELTWTTVSETDNDYWTIERSKDGVNWDFVSNLEGLGSSSIGKTYFEVDRNPYLGTTYYRLKQTDFNGDFSYSPVTSVNLDQKTVTIYPNPAQQGEKITFSFNDQSINKTVIKIVSLSGQIVDTHDFTEMNDAKSVIISTDQLAPGIYTLVANDQIKKFVIR